MSLNKYIKYLLSIAYIFLYIMSLDVFAYTNTSHSFKSFAPLCPLALSTNFTAVSCSGGNDGSASVSVSSGSGNYSYNWSGGQTGITSSALTASTYTITVTDNTGGCTATATVIVTQPTAITVSTTKTDVSCAGVTDGTATANPNGGNGTYTYSWTNGQTTQTATGLVAGSYIIKVTDIKGCTKTSLVTIVNRPPITISLTSTNISCNGGTTGSIVAVPAGGTSPFNYNWSNSTTSATASGLAQGTYTVTVTDSKGCTLSSTATLTQPAVLGGTTARTNVLCKGVSSGSATVTPAGGIAGYTYLWSGTTQTGATINSLAAGTYIVTITDANGCTTTTSAIITEPPLLTVTTASTQVLCFGASTGASSVTPGGGAGGYAYTWNSTPVQNTAAATGLPAGSYTVTVKDINGCTVTTSVTLTQPTVLTSSISAVNLTCYNAGNGKATASPSGGVVGYTYSWSVAGQTGVTATNLAAGSYTVTVRDANNCSVTTNVTVTEPPAVITSKTGINVSCTGYNDGKAWVTPNGSKPPYVYAWTPSLGINDTIFGLTAGNYSVTVTDAVGCKQSTIITITEPTPLTGTVSSTNSSCNGATNGTATIVPAGSTPAYTYLWNTTPPQTTATASNLGPGTFTIKLSDSKGCEFYATVTISEAAPIFINNPTITKESCQLGNGKISITVIGGLSPYTYSWNPTAQTSATAVNLSSGTYSVTVTDSKGCSTTKTAVVTNQFSSPTAFANTVNNISCFGAADGKTSVTASAGTPAYAYSWSPSGGVGITASNLIAGTYTIKVTDANGCTVTSTTTITEPASMVLNESSTNATCGLTNGTASVAPTGGTLPFAINWSNGAIGKTASNLASGSYIVTVTDASGCSLTKNITINIANPLTINSSSTDITCNGASNGTISVTAAGGTGVFNYTWAPSGGPGSSSIGLGAGTYTITVSDAGNAACSGTTTEIITQPSALTTPIAVVDITCSGGNSGQVSVSPTGGSGAYTYIWSTGGTANAITGLAAGGYTVSVTDANGCNKTANGTVVQNSAMTANVTGTNVKCFGQSTGQAVVTIGGGSSPYAFNWAPTGGTGITASTLSANTYTVTVTDAGGCTITATTTITQPASALNTSTSKVNATCGSNNGTANVSPSGGVTSYTYAWSNGGAAATITNLAPGTFTVTVNDANGCAKTATVSISVSNSLTVSVVKTNVTCNSAGNGTATLTPAGGSGTYNYNWSPGGYLTNTVNTLTPATYTITITDAGNAACSRTTTVSITQPAILNSNLTGVNISCNGNNNGQASSSPAGGTSPFTYNWSTGSTSSAITGLSPNTYTLTVTDSKGCTTSRTVTISQGAALAVSINSQVDVTCFGLANGSTSVNASGGTGALTYAWSPSGGNGATASGLSANSYTVSINDVNNCASTIVITITEPPELILSPATTTATCGISDGTATISPTGGTTPYTYNWSNGGISANIIGLAPGTYTVTVRDANNCSRTETATIIVGNPIALITNKSDLTCNGSNNGLASVSATGGSGNYIYTWAPGGATSSTITGLAAGNYTITVIDAVNSGCTASTVIIINQPNPLIVTVTPTDIICFGQTNGTTTAMPNGGTVAYTYNWAPVAGTGTGLNNLGVGTYSVTVSDANGCTATNTAAVTEPLPLTLVLDSVNVSCIGAYDGSIDATVGGGVPTYTYNWAPTGGSTDSIGGLGPGIYTLTVTDANECTIVRSITITEPPPFYITTSEKDPTCYSNNGEAYVSVTGGTGPFSFLWTPTGSTNDTITNLAPGTYQVQVIDLSTGCDTIGTVTLAWPVVSLNLDLMNVTCKNFNNAKAWVIASGATAPYTYSWNFGTSINDTIIGLSPGSYTVTVYDNGGCVSTGSISVTEPVALSMAKTSTNVNCFAGTDGTTDITPAGGTTPYTYSWSSGQTTSSINTLVMGTYKITLTDSNSCVLIDSILITQPTKLNVSGDSINISCFGNIDGQVFVNTTGGTGTYTYAWAPGGATGTTITGLTAGVYTITVLDQNECSAADIATVVEPTVLSLAMNKADPNCGQTNGKASVTASGSNGSYTYQWAPIVSTNDTIVNLAKGTYIVTVTDINGCSSTNSIEITEPDVISATTDSTNVTCNGANNGIGSVIVTGGSGNYNYTWSPGGYTSATVTNLSPGTYTVTIKDITNTACVLVDSVTITQPPALITPVTSTNVTCFSNGDGTATVTAAGGTGAYTFAWSNGSTTNNISNLLPNTYTITVTDANTCTSTASTTLTQPLLLTAIADSIDINCNGYNNGKVFVVANGGTAPYNYIWDPGTILNDTLSDLAPGSFTVTVSDANGCTTTDMISITEPPGMTLTMNRTNTACGSNIGTAGVSVSGGSTPYTYLWSNAKTSTSITGLFKGLYKVTVTDNKGCTKVDSANVVEPNGIVISFAATNITCNGGNNGKVTVTATGGTSSYIYSWIPGGNTSTTLTNLATGTYVIKVTDATNLVCSSIDSVIITQPAFLTGIMSKTNVPCFNDSTGIASVAVSGGTAPYTYSWSIIGSTGSAISGLKQGSYTVSISDNNGCTTVNSVTINQPPAIIINTSIKQASCGNSDGEAYVSAAGGTAPFIYSWTPVYTTNDTLTNLLPGKYYVYVNDANGCIKKDSATITLANGINTTLTAVSVTCFGDEDGSATVSANGGSGVFTYQWGPISNSNQNIFNLAPGMYTVTVTDININGCIKIDSILVPEPAVVDFAVVVTKSACSGNNNFVATAYPTGGTPGYNYNWSFGGANQSETGLTPGTYIIAVSDSKGCDTAKIFTINSSSTPFILPPSKVNPKCNLSNGSISVTIFGGVQPYTYNWNPSVSTGPVATNLASGVYTLTVTDAYNCTDSRTISIINTALPPNVFASTNPAICFGTSTGSATANANAGSVPYTYSWSPSGGINPVTSPVPAGIYTIVVTDAQACTATATATVTEPPDIAISFLKKNVSCFSGTDGAVSAQVGGGTPGYAYSWSSGGMALAEQNLAAGTYSFTVTDSQACVKSDSVSITQPPILATTIAAVSNVFCNGGSNGKITVSTTGGTPNYKFSWTPMGGTDSVSTLLPAGSYTVTIVDSLGCTITNSAVITQPLPYTANVIQKNVSCYGGKDGQAKVIVSGASAPYLYSWAPVSNFTDTVSNLTAGIYSIYVIDSLGCPYTIIDTITQPSKINISISKTDVTCTGIGNGTATASVSGGTPPYSLNWITTGGTSSTISNLVPGTYIVYANDANGCLDSSTVVISEPTPLILVTSKADLICYNDFSGTASVVASGATPAYTYSWMPGNGTGSSINGLKAGSYTVIVNDFYGCSQVDSVLISEPTPILANATQVNVICFGQKTGSAALSASGGTPGYSYIWSTGNVTPNITPVFAGKYIYTITDSKGCKLIDSLTITQASQVTITAAGFDAKCFNSCDGQAVALPSNGVPPYVFAWSNGGTNAGISNICAGGYTIVITDASGCMVSSNVTINQPTPLTLITNSSTAHCGINDGTVTVSVSGASPPYNYLWNPGGYTGNSVDSLIAGNYTVIVTDINGCTDSASVNVGNANGPDVSISNFTNTSCANACSGTATSVVSGGTGPYTYSWNTIPTQSTSNAQNLCAGTYFVSVTDKFGCPDTAYVTIKAPTIKLAVTANDTDICIGQSVQLSAIATDGSPAYAYTWNNGAFVGQNYTVNPTSTTIYTVMVTDATGCPSLPVTIKVNVKLPLVVTANASPAAACPGTTFTVTVTATGGDGTYSYTWQPGGFVGTSITVAPAITTTYTITGNDGCNTPPDTAVVTIQVYPDPVVKFIASDTIGCLNVCTDFTDQSTVVAGSTITSWLWSFGDGTTSTLKNPSHCYNSVGKYNVTLTVKTDKGCTKTRVKPNYINILGLPVAEFDANPDSVSVLEPLVNFTDKSSGALNWRWDFGDGSKPDSLNYLQHTRHTYKDTGTYCIWQVVTNLDGCTDSIKHCLRVYPEFSFYIPNAFSPNGDGINDGFNGKGTYIIKYKMMVFDRWGNLIFVTDSLLLDWDGRANYGSEIAQQDVYVWKVVLTDVFKREHRYMGHVTLVK